MDSPLVVLVRGMSLEMIERSRALPPGHHGVLNLFAFSLQKSLRESTPSNIANAAETLVPDEIPASEKTSLINRLLPSLSRSPEVASDNKSHTHLLPPFFSRYKTPLSPPVEFRNIESRSLSPPSSPSRHTNSTRHSLRSQSAETWSRLSLSPDDRLQNLSSVSHILSGSRTPAWVLFGFPQSSQGHRKSARVPDDKNCQDESTSESRIRACDRADLILDKKSADEAQAPLATFSEAVESSENAFVPRDPGAFDEPPQFLHLVSISHLIPLEALSLELDDNLSLSRVKACKTQSQQV